MHSSKVKLSFSSNDSVVEASSRHRPKSMSVSVDGGRKLILKSAKNTEDSGLWQTNEFIIKNQVFSGQKDKSQPISLSLVFLIEFESLEKKMLNNPFERFLEQVDCDVKFIFEDGQKIEGHVGVLAEKSPVFAAMFQHGMQEAKTGEVHIEDVDPVVFEQLLYYMYAGDTKIPLTEALAQSLYVISDKYDVADLKEKCLNFLLSSIQPDNVISMLVWSERCFVDKIKAECLSFSVKRGQEIFLKDIVGWNEMVKFHPDLNTTVIRSIIEKVADSVNWLN